LFTHTQTKGSSNKITGGQNMSDIASIKNSLLQLKGKPAHHVTHALKTIEGGEDGSMIGGLIKIVDRFIEDKRRSVATAKRKYGIGSYLGGTVVTGLFVGGVWLYSKHKDKKQHDKECEDIVKVFEDEVVAADENVDVTED